MDEESRDTRHGRQILRFALGVVVGARRARGWSCRPRVGSGDAIAALGRTNPAWLAPAIAFEAAAYVLGGVRLRRLAGSEVQTCRRSRRLSSRSSSTASGSSPRLRPLKASRSNTASSAVEDSRVGGSR